jgi:hypothetical protein
VTIKEEMDTKRLKVPELMDTLKESWVSQQAEKQRSFELPNKTKLKERSD